MNEKGRKDRLERFLSSVMLVAFRDEVEKLLRGAVRRVMLCADEAAASVILRGAVRRNRRIHESQKLLSPGGSAEHPEPVDSAYCVLRTATARSMTYICAVQN